MTGEAAASRARAPDVEHGADYTGAVYGSLLAASVVAGSGSQGAPEPVVLVVVLLATGLVFWLAHVYAQLFGDRANGILINGEEIRTVAAREWPIVQAAVPPALAAAIAGLVGWSDQTAAWLALLVALVAQLGWAVYAAAKAGVPGWLIAASGAVNLVMGLFIVALKVFVGH